MHISFQKEIGWQIVCQPKLYGIARGGTPAMSLKMKKDDESFYTTPHDEQHTKTRVSWPHFLGKSPYGLLYQWRRPFICTGMRISTQGSVPVPHQFCGNKNQEMQYLSEP
jgi:hypothetical protein